MKHPLLIHNALPTNTYTDIFAPFDGSLVGSVEKADELSCKQALNNATESFHNIMKPMPAWKRAEILYNVADLVRTHHEELSLQIAREGGKPLKDAKGEVTRAIQTIKMSGDMALQLNGEQLTMDRAAGSEQQLAFTIREPIGPVLAISAFNHPVNLIAHQVATAIAAGNSVIVKPASQTPLSCLTLAGYFYQAGLDPKALSVVTVGGAQMEILTSDPRIAFITFIGGEDVGWNLRKTIAPGTRLSLELGGVGSALIEPTANIDKILPGIIRSAFYHAGQVCVSLQNLYIHTDIIESTLPKIIDATNKLITGDSTSTDTDVGPLINKKEIQRIQNIINESIEQGATLLTGGEVLHETCLTPTILKVPHGQLPSTSKEIFGPVLNIIPYTDRTQVIEELNARPYAFQTAIYSDDITIALDTAKKIECVGCMINNPTTFRVDWMPFGGAKKSGLGLGGVAHSIQDMTQEKLIVINLS